MRKKIDVNATREIDLDFAKLINDRKQRGPQPSVDVINFRNWQIEKHASKVYEVPTELLRFRKENGRIASDVISFEKNYQPLNEKDKDAQKQLKEFLRQKDTKKRAELMNSIKHDGQRDPAIITADGFLINGNRRKMAFEDLYEETKDDKFTRIKVVILPGLDSKDEGGPPTIKEIEQLENRYQYQSDGKSEYTNFDKALSMRRKIARGIPLEELLRDDPSYASLDKKQFDRAKFKVKDDFLGPLECVDDYLQSINLDGRYDMVSPKAGSQGRWDAIVEYYKNVRKKLYDDKKRHTLGVLEDEVGLIEENVFKMIRKREFPGKKLSMLIRKIPSILKNPEAKKSFMDLVDVENQIPEASKFDEDGNEYPTSTQEKVWESRNQEKIIRAVNTALQLETRSAELETSLTLLGASLKKLQHSDMDPTNIPIGELQRAIDLTKEIQLEAKELERKFWNTQKKTKKLVAD